MARRRARVHAVPLVMYDAGVLETCSSNSADA
jgi:hypothetical protein